MTQARTLILNQEQIKLKLQRMVYQIWEQNADQTELIMIGIADNGFVMAKILAEKLEAISPIKVKLISLTFDKLTPLKNLPLIEENLDGKSVLLVDDVANSGKVLLYALRPVLNYFPARINMAVLVDRKHKSYPVNPNIVGHSISTTLQENITVESDGTSLTGVYLD
ncbi:MAG: phosphoribosyltransferase family protein [Chitinophagaceae bacterium]|jgi:pyrimidine operon attenuation protein/uracil phosphoribosyltransferase